MFNGVNPSKEEALRRKMAGFGINERDIFESFVRSSGKGGQKVNKTSSCVYLKHLPTGIEVKCQNDRCQSVNRFLARRVLVEKIEEKILGAQSRRQQEIEKIRRQKRKRSKRSKEKMLEQKRIVSEKKELRSKVNY